MPDLTERCAKLDEILNLRLQSVAIEEERQLQKRLAQPVVTLPRHTPILLWRLYEEGEVNERV